MKKYCAVALIASSALLSAGQQQDMVEWPVWSGDNAQSKYSSLPDITPANVHQLEQVWEWNTGELPLKEFGTRPGGFQATPLMIQNRLYLSTPYHRVVALDAETGAEIWAFDPEASKGREDNIGLTHRGVAYWRGSDARIFINTDNRLFALDPDTGKPIASFGQGGFANLTDGLVRPIKEKQFSQTSPPVIYKNLVIVGSRVPDRSMYRGDTPGTVQAFDVLTGKRAWLYYTTPQSPDDPRASTWEGESWRYTGHSNVWGPMSVDDNLGLVFVPVSTPSSDYWGGRRPGQNLCAECIVALDASSGKVAWYFQAVHHGLWDLDFPAAPNLVTITVDGRRIDAIAEISKQGFTYVFERATGKPVWPIEERPVDTETDVPHEKPWPTQPFPTKPTPFAVQGVSLDDANDLTPEIKALAVERMSQFRLGPLFTPPSLRGTLQRPMNTGGANWPGAAFDPETGRLYFKSSEGISTNQVCKSDGTVPDVDLEYSNDCEFGALGPFQRPGVQTGPRGGASKLGPIPMIKPPYGNLISLDLNLGEIAWKVPFGEGSPAVRNHPLLKGVTLPERLGTTGAGGVMVTKTGLVFIAGGEPYLYAFDKTNGRELWRLPLPARATASPMTYRARNGRQFVVVASGSGPDSTLVAFALASPQPPNPQ